MSKELGTTYLLHFEKPYKHARHYLGWAIDLDRRLEQQADINLDNLDKESHERGAILMAYVNSANIKWSCIRTWNGVTRDHESKLKRNLHLGRYCPRCREGEKVKANQRYKIRKEKKKENSSSLSTS